jgi:sigma-B regulation protein RsbU (phosphoserine phosphatase)
MGMETPADVMRATPEQIAQGFETFDENGVELLADRYPSRRIMQGDLAPEPLVVRTRNLRTGREYWRVVKASPVFSDTGELLMTVSITEDITEIKRAEEAQRHIAATLQSSLLPEALPEVDGFRIATMYRPAGRETWVGGDFYDAFKVDDGWMVVVGDVTGSGAEAAAMTAQARHTLRAIGEQTGDHVAAISRLNRLLFAGTELALCTVCMVRFTGAANGHVSASVACGGHPLPYLVRRGTVDDVGKPGPLVGAWEAAFTSTEIAIEPGDILVLYTDGVIEARGSGDDRFGEVRFRELLGRARDAEDVVQRVGVALDEFQCGDQADDTALVVVEYLGGAH